MEIYFCESCGTRVNDVELGRSEGKLVDGLAWCAKCADKAPSDAPAAPALGGQAANPTSQRRTPGTPLSSRRRSVGSSQRLRAASGGRVGAPDIPDHILAESRAARHEPRKSGFFSSPLGIAVPLIAGLFIGLVAFLGFGGDKNGPAKNQDRRRLRDRIDAHARDPGTTPRRGTRRDARTPRRPAERPPQPVRTIPTRRGPVAGVTPPTERPGPNGGGPQSLPPDISAGMANPRNTRFPGQIHYEMTFNRGLGYWENVAWSTARAYRGSSGAAKGKVNLNAQYFPVGFEVSVATMPPARRDGVFNGRLFETQGDTVVAFAYYLEGASTRMTIQGKNVSKGINYKLDVSSTRANEWTVVAFRVMEFRPNGDDGPISEGDRFRSMGVHFGRPGENVNVVIDSFVIASGATADEVTAYIRGTLKAEPKATPRPSSGTDLVSNGGMERLGPNGVPERWDANDDPNMTFSAERADVREGAQALRVRDRSIRQQGKIWQRIREPALSRLRGKQVRFSVWMKAVGSPAREGYLSIYGRSWGHKSNNNLTIGTEWKRYEVEHRIPSDVQESIGVYVTVCGPAETGEVLVDDARLEILGGTAPVSAAAAVASAPSPSSRARAGPASGAIKPDPNFKGTLNYFVNFDKDTDHWGGVERTTTRTFRGSAGALKGVSGKNNYYAVGMTIANYFSPGGSAFRRKYSKGMFQNEGDTVISLAYYFDGPAYPISFMGWNTDQKNNFIIKFSGTVSEEWGIATVRLGDFENKGAVLRKCQKGDWFQSMSVLIGPKGTTVNVYLDNFVVSSGGLPADVTAYVDDQKRLLAESTARPATDGYYLEPKVIKNLIDRYDASKVTAKKLAAVGGGAAASASFDTWLKQKHLKKTDGYTWANKMQLAGRNKTAASIRKYIDRRLKAEKPELVRICFGLGAMSRGTSAMQAQPDVGYITQRVLENGAIPILYTLPVRTVVADPRRPQIQAFNTMIMDMAKRLELPYVDAWGMLNNDPAMHKQYFRRARLSKKGLELLNGRFLKLYKILERRVMNRAPPKPAAPAGGKDVGIDDEPARRPAPRKKPKSNEDAEFQDE